MSDRRWMWIALAVQGIAAAWEALWHGLHPDFEHAVTRDAMLAHLGTVHIPFYIAIVALVLATGTAVGRRLRRAEPSRLMTVAFVAAIGQVIGQAWDVWAHTRLSNGGPVAWTLIAVAPIATLIVLVVDGRRRHRSRERHRTDERRAA